MSLYPTLIGYLQGGEVVGVSGATPMPVVLADGVAPSAIDNLLWGSVAPTNAASSAPTHVDLAGNSDGETPTIVNAKDYKRFILTGWHPAPSGLPTAMTLNAALWARATDPSGAPLHTSGTAVWYKVGDFTLSTSLSAGYFRAVLETPDGKPLGFDAYRITLNVSFVGGTNPSLGAVNAVLRGER